MARTALWRTIVLAATVVVLLSVLLGTAVAATVEVPHEVVIAFETAYSEVGGAAAVGNPTNEIHQWPAQMETDVWVRDYDSSGWGGAGVLIMPDGGTTAYWVHGGIWTKYLGMGGPWSHFGCPVANEHRLAPLANGTEPWYQEFEGGEIWHHHLGPHSDATYLVYGLILQQWWSLGGPTSSLGMPISDEYAAGDDRRSDFESGYILWNSTEGCRVFSSQNVQGPGFPDVPADNPFHDAISDLSSRGIIDGYANGDFGPTDPVTRQQFAKMIVGTGEYPVSEGDICPFTDVAIGDASTFYPDNFVAVCAAHGITTGKTATTFDPYAKITRYQVISMVTRAADDLDPGLLSAAPAGSGAWANDPVHGTNAARAEHNGLLAGLDLAALDPYGDMSRGEVAQVLYNLKQALSAGITPATIRQLTASASAFSPEQIQVVDYKTAGNWAAALVTVVGQESPIFIFTKVGGAWTVSDGGTDFAESDLQSAGVPTEIIDWIKTKGYVS